MTFGFGGGIDCEVSNVINIFLDAAIELGSDLMGYKASLGGKYKF
jgi:hypothetical protein